MSIPCYFVWMCLLCLCMSMMLRIFLLHFCTLPTLNNECNAIKNDVIWWYCKCDNCNQIFIDQISLIGESEGTFCSFRVKLPSLAHLFTTHGTNCFFMLNVKSGISECQFLTVLVWLDPTGNRTKSYRFSSRRSFHSTTGQKWWWMRRAEQSIGFSFLKRTSLDEYFLVSN